MSIEAIAAASAGGGAGPPPPMESAQISPSVSDMTSFQGSMSSAATPLGGPDSLAPAMKAVMAQMEQVNGQAKSIGEYAKSAAASGAEMTPGETVQLTMRAHEFMFNCQLTSNIANRTSDGLQQLFKQQG